MVRVEVTGTEEQARTFMEGLTDVHPDSSEIKIPVKALIGKTPAKVGNAIVAPQYVSNTGNI